MHLHAIATTLFVAASIAIAAAAPIGPLDAALAVSSDYPSFVKVTQAI
ncbi:hypothetical protein ANCCAN_17755 [Ancylostoma caninum]|uniref:Nematode cuticle collagen N-terminal domain-containing protein n=1 Tax=Ancylostoma caninum TaxID=29170 RepID=A0A368FW19_ANCCA|nr:hypothetical protein ANCCAN_17755 [Ancylostoma caninum]